jgi:hypothetical protein
MFTFPKCAPHVASDRFFTAGSFAGFLPLKRKRRTLGSAFPKSSPLQTGLGNFDNIGHARFKFCFLTLGPGKCPPTWSLPPCAAMNMATADRQ